MRAQTGSAGRSRSAASPRTSASDTAGISSSRTTATAFTHKNTHFSKASESNLTSQSSAFHIHDFYLHLSLNAWKARGVGARPCTSAQHILGSQVVTRWIIFCCNQNQMTKRKYGSGRVHFTRKTTLPTATQVLGLAATATLLQGGKAHHKHAGVHRISRKQHPQQILIGRVRLPIYAPTGARAFHNMHRYMTPCNLDTSVWDYTCSCRVSWKCRCDFGM